MKNKVLLNVFLPATQKSYEFRVPLDSTVGEGARLMADLLASREQVRYASSEDADLMPLEGEGRGAILNPKETLKFYVIHGRLVDGSSVVLV